MSKKKLLNIVKVGSYWAIVGCLAIHFLIVAISVGPDNPVKHIYKNEVADYMHPHFNQNWNLFAPNPISSNHTLAFQYEIYSNGDTIQTEWGDVLEPIIKARKESIWTPLQRLEKYISNLIETTFEDRGKMMKYLDKEGIDDKSDIEADSMLIALEDIFENTYTHACMLKYGYYTFQKMYGNQYNTLAADSVKLNYRLIDAKFPRFSKRKEDYYDQSLWDIDHFQFGPYKIYEGDGSQKSVTKIKPVIPQNLNIDVN